MIARRRAAIAATSLAAVFALTACLPPMEQVAPTEDGAWPGGDGSSAGTGGSVYDQTVTWSKCGALECATIEVPLDWASPDGPRISLAINRSPARKPDEKLGSLLINPGGPGGSGLDLTDYFVSFAGDSVLDHYDIVGFDPRGVGQSTPIDCGTGPELDAYLLSQDVAEKQADVVALEQRNTDFANRCLELSGRVIENVDTASAARDMDVIRAVLGDDKLTYVGFSYGTELGATYAMLYPDNVGRMVLDGMVDFLLDPEALSVGQASGFESALDAYLTDCFTTSACPFPHDLELAKRQIRDLEAEARDNGLPTDGDPVNGTKLVYGIVVTLYSEGSWSLLSQAFDEALNNGTARGFEYLGNYYLDRQTDGTYLTNSSIAFTAISCLDQTPGDPWTIDQYRAFSKQVEAASPTFGWWFAAGVGCEGWPWTAREHVLDLSQATTTTPIVVVGTTGDPATPYEWAQTMSKQLPNATLVTYNGEGHTAYGRSNQCILDAIDGYLVDGVVPDSGLEC